MVIIRSWTTTHAEKLSERWIRRPVIGLIKAVGRVPS